MTPFEIEQLWLEYHPKVYGYFFRRLNSRLDVEDLTSVTLTAFVNKLVNNPGFITNQNAFLWQIARNQLMKFINTKSKEPAFVDFNQDIDVPDDDQLENYVSEHLDSRIEHLMKCVEKTLKGQDYLIIQHVIMYDKKAVDVAKDLNLQADNVRQKMSRGLKKLREKCRELWEI